MSSSTTSSRPPSGGNPPEAPASGEAAQPNRRKTRRHIELARRRQMSVLQKRRQQKRTRVLLSRIRAMLRVVCAVGLVAGLTAWVQAPYWQLSSPAFHVAFQGGASGAQPAVPAAAITPLLNDQVGRKLWEIHPQALEARILKRFPILQRVSVRRALFPTRLDVVTVEKRPWAALFESVNGWPPRAVVAHDHRPIPWTTLPAGRPRTLLRLLLPSAVATPPPQLLAVLDGLSRRLDAMPGLRLRVLDARNPQAVEAWFSRADAPLAGPLTLEAPRTPDVAEPPALEETAPRPPEPVLALKLRMGALDDRLPNRLARLEPLVTKLPALWDRIDTVDLRWQSQLVMKRRAGVPAEAEADAAVGIQPALTNQADLAH